MRLLPTLAAMMMSLILAPAALALTEPAAMPPSSLSLSAQGEVRAPADMATLTLGVVSEAPTAAEAIGINAAEMTRVLAALKTSGLAARDLQTSGLNLSPQYDYTPGQSPKLRGYQVANQITVTARDLSRLGALIDATVRAGANSAGQINLGLANPLAAENRARLLAVKALNDKASLYAKALGYASARLVSLKEGSTESPPVFMARMAAAPMADGGPTPVAPGEMTVSVNVSGVFELVP